MSEKEKELKKEDEIIPEVNPNPYQDLIGLIQDKQVELSLKKSTIKEIKVGDATYKRKPLSTKQWREIFKLNSEMSSIQDDELARLDKLIELRTKAAEFYFGIPNDIFDQNYEDLSPAIEGCILRSNTGLSPDIDFDEILQKYKAQTKKQ